MCWPAGHSARAGVWGPPHPDVALAQRARAWPRRATKRAAQRGHKAQGDSDDGRACALLGGHGEVGGTSPPCPTVRDRPSGGRGARGTEWRSAAATRWAGVRGPVGDRGSPRIKAAPDKPRRQPPLRFAPLGGFMFGGGAGKGGSQGGKTEGGVDVVRCARHASSVRMAGHQSKGRDSCRQRSGRNFEAGPMAVTVTALAARHFRSRRPSSQQASVLRRLEGHDEPRCGRSLQPEGGMPLAARAVPLVRAR